MSFFGGPFFLSFLSVEKSLLMPSRSGHSTLLNSAKSMAPWPHWGTRPKPLCTRQVKSANNAFESGLKQHKTWQGRGFSRGFVSVSASDLWVRWFLGFSSFPFFFPGLWWVVLRLVVSEFGSFFCLMELCWMESPRGEVLESQRENRSPRDPLIGFPPRLRYSCLPFFRS